MRLRLLVLLTVVLAVAIGLRLYTAQPAAVAENSLDLPDELDDGPAPGPLAQTLPNFPTTFPSDLPTPKPDMSPDESVRTVMAALRDNDSPVPEAGVATTFNFASPGNKLATGPLPHFAAMVHSPAYAPLINHKSSRVAAPQIQGNLAITRVDVTDAAGHTFTYLWQMSQQPDHTWLTDAVQPVETPPPTDAPKSGI